MKKVILSEDTYESVVMCMEWELQRENEMKAMGSPDMEKSIDRLERAVEELKKAVEVES